MALTLQELGKEYENSIRIQKEAIEDCRARLVKAREKYNCSEIKRLNTLLRVLYDEKNELEERANQLREYYT